MSMTLKRRQLLASAAGLAASGLMPGLMPGALAAKAPKHHVIVIGGGMAGATVAKYLRLCGDRVAVTLIDRNAQYTSCIMSSLVLTGQRSMGSLRFKYDTLRQKYGVNIVTNEVLAVDPSTRTVTLAGGGTLSADRVVMAPGIEFDAVPGLTDPNAMPHAWKAGSQFLAELDGFHGKSSGVLVLGATNVPWAIDPAFRRPGRFDRVLVVPPPDRAARAAILRIQMAGRPAAQDVDLDWIAGQTVGYSGADLELLVEEAVDAAIQASLGARVDVPVGAEHLRAALGQVRPKTHEWFAMIKDQASHANDGGQYDEAFRFIAESARGERGA